MESFKKGWKPRNISAWLLTLVACLLALFVAVLAYCMVVPAPFNNPGGFGKEIWR
jgi:hypothetical protein